MSPNRIDTLLTHLYESVLAPDGFQRFVGAFIELFQLKAAMLLTVNRQTQEIKGLWMEGLQEKWMTMYAMEYAAEDVLAHHIHSSPIATFYASNLDLPAGQVQDTRFYREWVEPQGVAWASGAIVLHEGPWLTQMMLQRTPQQPPFAREELDLFNLLMPHLQRALQMRQRFAELQLGQNLLISGLDVIAMPAILIDEFCRVAHCNRAAGVLLQGRRDLWLEESHLFCRSGTVTQQMNLEITKAIHASQGTAGDIPGVVLVPRVAQRDLMVLISPMRMAARPEVRSGALLFVFDPEAAPHIRTELVQRLFGLSEAEAQLAVAICSGLTPEAASVERGTSLNTVRTQLKSIFAKTGTSRQADLVSVLLASPAYFLSHPSPGP
jgi:DNA-binding CsgD family transcriptional regulator